jgi:hypothetical protein
MDKAAKGTSNVDVSYTSSSKIKTDSGSAGLGGKAASIGGAWVREDGAICFGNECVVIHVENGQTFMDVDATACGAEIGKAIVTKLMDGFSDGSPINIRVKPTTADK